MTELPRLAQPYPDSRPWVDLMAFVEPSWRFMQIYSVRLNERGSLSFEARTLRRPA